MKTYLDLDTWNRSEHFRFFSTFDNPFFGVTFNVDCTAAYAKCKTNNWSFYGYYLHKILSAVNQIDNFKYRIQGDRIVVHPSIHASATVARPDHTFGFSHVEYHPELTVFQQNLFAETARVQNTTGLFTRDFPDNNVIHFSALPWLNFTALSHAQNFDKLDSCPKISVGKLGLSANQKHTMPISIHVHHGLMDGYHVGVFAEQFQTLMNE